MVSNGGNVPLSISGLERYQAMRANGSACSSSSLAPGSSITCDFFWNVSTVESEAGNGTIFVAVNAAEPATNASSFVFKGSAALMVPQHAGMAVDLEEVPPKIHVSNSKCHCSYLATKLMQGLPLPCVGAKIIWQPAVFDRPCAA